MRRADVLQILRRHRAELRALGVARMFLFGSVARDEADGASDVDLLISPASETFSLFDLIRVQDETARLLGAPVEVHDHAGLARLPAFQRSVERDLVDVF
jgi:predicted nucleotidyltransferase